MNIDIASRPLTSVDKTTSLQGLEPLKQYSPALQDTKQVKNVQAERPEEQDKEQQTQDISSQELSEAVDTLNEASKLRSKHLAFAMNEDSNQIVISVLDNESGEVIRQIPSEEVLEIAAKVRNASVGEDLAVGVLFDSKI